MNRTNRTLSIVHTALAAVALAIVSPAAWADGDDDDEVPFPAAVMIIELTEEDIEIQVFADGHWGRFQIKDPKDRKIFDSRVRRTLRRQNGVSEIFFASVPSHYLEDEPDFDEPIEDFLHRWPAGSYEFESWSLDGDNYESEVEFSHLMPALPEIVFPISDTDDPVEVDSNVPLVIDWYPVIKDFLDGDPVEIMEYQVIVDQVDPERENNWVDGGTRRALINVPGNVTQFTLGAEFLTPDSGYEFEILAIEKNGNSTISVGEFVTSELP